MTIDEYKALIGQDAKKSKYRARRVFIDGIWFDSKKEGNRFLELKLLISQGYITDLECQKPFTFEIDGKKMFTYKADFVYFDKKLEKTVIEDVKSDFTKKNPVYRLKKKILEAHYKIEITEYI